MPTDPATVPPISNEDVREIHMTYGGGAAIRAAYTLAASRVDTAEVEREVVRKAFTKGVVWARCQSPASLETVAEGFAREYPAPAPRECVLSDRSVVTVDAKGGWERTGPSPLFTVSGGNNFASQWHCAFRHWTDTGADFDALKRFAAEVGQ